MAPGARSRAGVADMFMRFILVAIAAVVGVLAAWTLFTLNWSYSAGERAGYVQKLSERGWICKTWEGEMAMVTMPGTVAEKFLFTVPDDAVARKINQTVGQRVVLQYEQHKWIPFSCFAETEYFVTNVREAEEDVGIPH